MVCFRHGNTFAPGAEVVCAGRQAGLPLVAEGRAQAERAGRALAAAGLLCDAWRTSPRLRAQQFAESVARAAGSSADVRADSRLDELDYGPWTGRTRADIVAAGGAEAVQAWDDRGAWPRGGEFGGDEATVGRELFALVAEAQAAGVRALLAVSHAGRMRYLPPLVTGAPPSANWPGPHRVRCGHATVLAFGRRGPRLLGADLPPAALAALLQATRAPRPASVP